MVYNRTVAVECNVKSIRFLFVSQLFLLKKKNTSHKYVQSLVFISANFDFTHHGSVHVDIKQTGIPVLKKKSP